MTIIFWLIFCNLLLRFPLRKVYSQNKNIKPNKTKWRTKLTNKNNQKANLAGFHIARFHARSLRVSPSHQAIMQRYGSGGSFPRLTTPIGRRRNGLGMLTWKTVVMTWRSDFWLPTSNVITIDEQLKKAAHVTLLQSYPSIRVSSVPPSPESALSIAIPLSFILHDSAIISF